MERMGQNQRRRACMLRPVRQVAAPGAKSLVSTAFCCLAGFREFLQVGPCSPQDNLLDYVLKAG